MKIVRAGTLVKSALLKTRAANSLVASRAKTTDNVTSSDLGLANKPIDMPSRTLNFNILNRFNQDELDTEFDLIIIGGGINGCGIANDASKRGLRVLLLEKDDFGGGCTSASSRLIHGGLRYLEHFEFDLVRESLAEREILLRNANHLVKPLELCIPIYKDDKRGYWLIKAGMLLYDLLSFDKSLPHHKMMSAGEFIKHEPGIKKDGLIGAALYYDAQAMYPERICLENILMAKNEGALVLNHAEVTGITLEANKISEVEFLDRLSNKKFKAKGKIIVNVSGPWVDSLCGLTNKNIQRKIGGTKGSHIIVRKFDNGPKHAIYASAKSDGRPFFIIPWQDYYLIGTTDIPFSGDLEHLKASENEIKYLLDEASNILDSRKLVGSDILFSYCGVRPLPSVDGSDPSKITRRHIIFDHKNDGINNFMSVIGGKLTTYRNLSEQAVNLVYKKLGYKFERSMTKVTPLIGNIDDNVDIETYKKGQLKRRTKKHDLESEIVFHLIDLYGKRYKEVLDLLKDDPDLGKLLSSYALDIRAQVDYAVRSELAFTISDVLLRRTSLGTNEGLGGDAIPQVAKQLQTILNYSNDEIEKQIHDYEERVVKLRKV